MSITNKCDIVVDGRRVKVTNRTGVYARGSGSSSLIAEFQSSTPEHLAVSIGRRWVTVDEQSSFAVLTIRRRSVTIELVISEQSFQEWVLIDRTAPYDKIELMVNRELANFTIDWMQVAEVVGSTMLNVGIEVGQYKHAAKMRELLNPTAGSSLPSGYDAT